MLFSALTGASMSWRPVIIAAFVVLVAWQTYEYGYNAGLSHGLNEANQASLELVGKLKSEKLNIIKELANVDQKYTDDLLTMQERINNAKREANEYKHITHVGDAADCPNVSDEWVLVHDTAADLSSLSSLSGIRDAETTGVDDGKAKTVENYQRQYTKKQAIQVITDNYAQCAEYINQLRALQDYVTTLIKSEDKETK